MPRKASPAAKPVKKKTPAKRTRRPEPAEQRPPAAPITFTAKLHKPAETGADWLFLNIPAESSAQLPSRGMVAIDGTSNGSPFQATLEPDGEGGHWLKVDRALRTAWGAKRGDSVSLSIAPASVEPEPEVPADIKKALAAAPAKAKATWTDITAGARRDWVFWMISGKKAETRPKRIATACDMLAKGKRRACCFDRSGMFSGSLSCPIPDND